MAVDKNILVKITINCYKKDKKFKRMDYYGGRHI
jgi:hypothetical protein